MSSRATRGEAKKKAVGVAEEAPRVEGVGEAPREGANLARYSAPFEGHPFTVYVFRGRPCAIAAQAGCALEYADEGKRLVDRVRDDWGDEAIEGKDFDILTGDDLREFKALLEDTPESGVSSTARLMVLYESGLDLVCIKTEKPLGKKLRRFVVDEVLPKLRRGEAIFPAGGNDSGTVQLAQAIGALTRALSGMETRMAAVEARQAPPARLPEGGEIGATAAELHILRPLRRIARLKAASIRQGDDAAVVRKLRILEERELRTKLRFAMDKRKAWSTFPRDRIGEAKDEIQRLIDAAEALVLLSGATSLDTVGPLFDQAADPRKKG